MNRRVRLTVRLGGGFEHLAEEAAILIATDHSQEGYETGNLRNRLIAMPLEIATHPENAPAIGSPDKRGFCNRMLHLFVRVLPVRADLEELNALAGYPVTKIELRSNVWRGPMALHKFRNVALAALPLHVIECHNQPRLGDA